MLYSTLLITTDNSFIRLRSFPSFFESELFTILTTGLRG